MRDVPDPDAYYRTLEEAFNRRRGAPLILSPRDWALMTEWRAKGIPIRIALQGIENSFDAYERRAPTARRINSLSYCRQEVLGLHEIYLDLHAAESGRPVAGAGTAGALAPSKAIARHLGRLVRRVREAMTVASEAKLDVLVGALASAAAELKLLRKAMTSPPVDPQPLEAALLALDLGLLDAARRSLPPAEVFQINASAAAALEPRRPHMTPEALETTRRAAVARSLRQRCRLPRLTLFD